MKQIQTCLLLLALILAAIVRLLYFVNSPSLVVPPDTYGYYKVGQKIISDPFFFFINEDRPPVYPLLLAMSTLMTQKSLPSADSFQFAQSLPTIIFFQSLVGLTTVLLFYFTLKLLGLNPLLSFAFSLFLGVNPNLFAWEKLPLTESLSIFLAAAVFFVSVKILLSPEKKSFLLLSILFLLAILVKPVFVAWPFIILTIIVLYKRTLLILLSSLGILAVYSSFLVLMIRHNHLNFQYAGLSRNTDINLLGKILQFDLSVEAASDSPFYESIKTYRKINGDPMPYRFLDYYNFSIYENPKGRFNELQKFNRIVLLTNLGEYTAKSLTQIKEVLLETSDFVLMDKPDNLLSSFFYYLGRLFSGLQSLTLLTIPFYPLSLFEFLRKSSLTNAAMFLAGTLSLFQILTSVFFSYGEFGRLLSLTQPFFYLFCFYFLGKAAFSLFKMTKRENPAKRKTSG